MRESEVIQSFSDQPVEFPPGETILQPVDFKEEIFSLVDDRLALGDCSEGRLELTTREARLTCLIHRSKPYVAGLQERNVFTQVPLYDFVSRSRQLKGAICTLVKTDMPLVLMTAIHFCKRPRLMGLTTLVDPAHVLEVLARERRDAAIAFERSGVRTLLFLKDGAPARLYFGDPKDDPREGSLEDRVLAYAFVPGGLPCSVEVFTDLRLEPDPDAEVPLLELAESAKPAPPVDFCLYYPDGRELRRRPYAGPEMIIGRDPAVDLFIDNLAVSRRHARISWNRGSFVLEDLGSANGTFLDGKPITRGRIDADSDVEIGKFGLSIYEYPAEPLVQETMFLPIKSPSAPGFLIGFNEPIRLDKDVIFGKGEGVDVQVKGFRVRPVHARLSFLGGEFELSCFGGAKVRVNDEVTRFAKLDFGDQFRIGGSRFQLVRKNPGPVA
jgi:hypothetical protein